jgi:hypothetical protein
MRGEGGGERMLQGIRGVSNLPPCGQIVTITLIILTSAASTFTPAPCLTDGDAADNPTAPTRVVCSVLANRNPR